MFLSFKSVFDVIPKTIFDFSPKDSNKNINVNIKFDKKIIFFITSQTFFSDCLYELKSNKANAVLLNISFF